jgi:hypothetical protein
LHLAALRVELDRAMCPTGDNVPSGETARRDFFAHSLTAPVGSGSLRRQMSRTTSMHAPATTAFGGSMLVVVITILPL